MGEDQEVGNVPAALAEFIFGEFFELTGVCKALGWVKKG